VQRSGDLAVGGVGCYEAGDVWLVRGQDPFHFRQLVIERCAGSAVEVFNAKAHRAEVNDLAADPAGIGAAYLKMPDLTRPQEFLAGLREAPVVATLRPPAPVPAVPDLSQDRAHKSRSGSLTHRSGGPVTARASVSFRSANAQQ
jgi:hypothetical protein